MSSGSSNVVYEFGPFRLDPRGRELRRDGSLVPLLPKSFDVLLVFVRHPGRLLDKTFLFAEVWPDTFVEENNLARAVSDIRKALGEGPKEQRYVATVPRHGYRFAAPVTTVDDPSAGGMDVAAGMSLEPRAPVAPAGPDVRPMARDTVRLGRWRLAALAGAGLLAAAALAVFARPGPPPLPLGEKDVIVLADVVNETGDPVFDGTLREALAAQLERSTFLSVMSEARIRQSVRLMGRGPDSPLTRELAREVCIREREKAMLQGSIASLGGSYVIALLATDCETGATLSREQEESTGKDHVLAALAKAASRTRARLGETLGSLPAAERHPITDVSTESLDAFQAFARGADLYRRGLSLEAIPLFQRATELDPGFAMAFQLLGNAYEAVGERARAVEYSRRAFALAGTASEWERLAIAAVYHMRVTGDAAQAESALQLFVHGFPRAPTPRAYRGAFYLSMGRFEQAAQDYRALLGLDRWSWIGYIDLMDVSLRLGDVEQVAAVRAQASALGLDSPGFHQVLLEAALVHGDGAAAAVETTWFRGRDDEYVSDVLRASSAIVHGQRREASRLLRRAADQVARRNLPGTAAVLMTAAAADPYGGCQLDDGIGFALRACPDVDPLLRDAERQSKERPADTLLSAVHLPMRRAAAALREERPADAIQLLASAEPFERRYPEVTYLRGMAHLAVRQGREAATEFHKLIDHKGVAWGPRYPLALLGLARAASQDHAHGKARQWYGELFALWRNADPDLPLLVQARKEFAALP